MGRLLNIHLDVQPELLERLVIAIEGIDTSLRLLIPSPLTQEDIPERERRPKPEPSGVDDISTYGDQEAARDYDIEGDGDVASELLDAQGGPLAFMERDPMMIDEEGGGEK